MPGGLLRWAVALICASLPVQAQEGPSPFAPEPRVTVQSPVLTIDSDRLFTETVLGQRLASDLRAETEALAAENRRIEAALTAEVESLTERRPGMEVEDFRAEADAFDERVQGIRRAQDAKERALQQAVQRAREALFEVAAPILGQLMVESGAAVVLERRSVFLSVSAIDITDEAIAAIDERIGDGAGLIDLFPAATDGSEDEGPPD